MEKIKKNNFNGLINNVYQAHCILKQSAERAVNQNLTVRNWLIGYYIVEFEQNGEDRAKYGTRLLEEMAKTIRKKEIRGLDAQSLRTCRTFYTLYPELMQPVAAVLNSLEQKTIRGSVSIELQNTDNQVIEICGTPSRKLKPIQSEEYAIPAELLLSRLSYSHFVEIIRRDDPLERLFYEVETIKNNWSVRDLERAINTALYVRTGLSKNKESIIAKFKNHKPARNAEVIRDPLFLEFLDMEERLEYSETELEQAILDHLQQFLIELGTGFCFEARQKRITFDNQHSRIDLVFYHRILKSHILIDLKIGKFDHSDAGQMNVYLNYYRENEASEGDNPPIGLILCGDKNEALAKYATYGMDNQLFVSKYLVNLPDKKTLENFIKKELHQ